MDHQEVLEALLDRIDWWALVFTIAVFVAIGGEAAMHFWSRHVNKELLLVLKTKEEERENRLASLAKETAEANERAAAANLALEKYKAPRRLTPEDFVHITGAARPFADIRFSIALFNDPESINLAAQIENALTAAGWIEIAWTGAGDIAFTRPGRPNAGVTSIQGLFVQADATRFKDFAAPVAALTSALEATGIVTKGEIGNLPSGTDKNQVQIQVGKKP